MELRQYQRDAIAGLYRHLRERDNNPCIVIPTGGGKTPIIATVCRDTVLKLNRRILVLTHVKELVEQAESKVKAIAPMLPVGIYSSGVGRKELNYPCTIAGIQSIYRKACELGKVDLILVDEAHLIPPKGEGMYRRFFDDARTVNPKVRIAGLTATPYRRGTGNLCHEDGILNEACYEIGVRELIDDGYLCPLKSRAGVAKVDTSAIAVRGSEFVAGEMQDAFDADDVVSAAVSELLTLTANRQSVLVFAAGVEHGQHVTAMIAGHGHMVRFVDASTPNGERDAAARDFKAGRIKYLVNVGIFTTGFNAPNVDCVVLLRATLSPGLYYQMVGRGFRIAPGKADCLVLDYGDNVTRHGPVDAIVIREKKGGGPAPAKECPECHSIVAAAVRECPDCGHAFPPPEPSENERHSARASDEGILSGEVTYETVDVDDVYFSVHHKGNDATATPTMRADYHYGHHQRVSEWLCFEHPADSYARRKAEQWWKKRSTVPVPDTVEHAVELASRGALADTLQVIVKRVSGNKYDELKSHTIGEIPDYREPGWDEADETPYAGPSFREEDIPF